MLNQRVIFLFSKKDDFIDPFFIEFRGKKRWMRPDLVFADAEGDLTIIDWKYMDANSFISLNKKNQTDITKQLCYELTLKKSTNAIAIESQFVIPSFGKYSHYLDDKKLHQRFVENKIKVFKADFLEIQNTYLTHD